MDLPSSELEQLFDTLAESMGSYEKEYALKEQFPKRVSCCKTKRTQGHNELYYIYESLLKESLEAESIDISEIIEAFRHCCETLPFEKRKRSDFKKCLLQFLKLEEY
jgi:hypothetical protein